MKTRFAAALVPLCLLALAACHSQPTAGGLSAEDERALDNAAAMLDDNTIAEMNGPAAADNGSAPAPAPTPPTANAARLPANAAPPAAGNSSGPRP